MSKKLIKNRYWFCQYRKRNGRTQPSKKSEPVPVIQSKNESNNVINKYITKNHKSNPTGNKISTTTIWRQVFDKNVTTVSIPKEKETDKIGKLSEAHTTKKIDNIKKNDLTVPSNEKLEKKRNNRGEKELSILRYGKF